MRRRRAAVRFAFSSVAIFIQVSAMQVGSVAIIVALITAASSLAITLVQHISQRRESRKLEALKSQLGRQASLHSEYLKAYLTFSVDGKKQQLQACRELLEATQVFRDKLVSVARNPLSYVNDVLSTEIRALSWHVADAFSRNQTLLPEPDWTIAHALKQQCVELSDFLAAYLAELPAGEPIVFSDDVVKLQQKVKQSQADLRKAAHGAATNFVESLRRQVDAQHSDQNI